MTKLQNDKLTASTLGMAFLQTNLTIITLIADILTNKNSCTAMNGTINVQKTIQQTNNKGRAVNKATQRENVELAVNNAVSKIIGSIYIDTNLILKGMINKTPSEVSKLVPNDLITFANSIVTNITAPILLLLVGSGLVTADLAAITTTVGTFSPVIADPKAAIAARKAATATMVPNFRTNTSFIKKISKLMINLISNDTFYNTWFNIIKAYKTGIRHTLRTEELAPSETIAWTKVIKNCKVINKSATGDIRIGAGTTLSGVLIWTTIPAGNEFLNTLGPNVIIQNLSPTSFLNYTLHSKTLKGVIV
jgi:hypothetical protein